MGFERHSMTVLGSENRADFAILELELTGARFSEDNPQEIRRKVEPWCVPICIIAGLILLIICLPLTHEKKDRNASKLHNSEPVCNETCRPHLSYQKGNVTELHSAAALEIMVPSIEHVAKYFGLDIQRNATDAIASFLKTIFGNRNDSRKSLTINILTSYSSDNMPIVDGLTREYVPHLAQLMFRNGSTIVRFKNASLPIAMTLWTVDGSSFYLDWGSVSIQGSGCRCVTGKVSRFFNLFWHATIDNRLVDGFFTEIGTNYATRTGGACLPNASNGLFSVLPEFLSHRTIVPSALVTLTKVIEEAREFLLLIVPAYDPTVGKLSNETLRQVFRIREVHSVPRMLVPENNEFLYPHELSPLFLDFIGQSWIVPFGKLCTITDLSYLRSLLALNDLSPRPISIKVLNGDTPATDTSFPVAATESTITLGASSIRGDPYFRYYSLSLTLRRVAPILLADRCPGSQSDLLKPMIVIFSKSSVEDLWFTGVEMFRRLWDNASDVF